MFFLPRIPMTTTMMMMMKLRGCLVVWRLEVGEDEDGEWRVVWYGMVWYSFRVCHLGLGVVTHGQHCEMGGGRLQKGCEASSSFTLLCFP